jgi:hypothetical protein
MKTIQELRKAGYKVKISHTREHRDTKNVHHRTSVPLYRRDEFKNYKDIWSKGGATDICIITPDGKEFSERVKCHRKDVFNRKTAINLGLVRIFGKNHLEMPK